MYIQTDETWPRQVASTDEVPSIFRDFVAELLAGADEFPYTVFVPSYGRWLNRSNPTLVCCFDDRVYVAEHRRKEVSAACHPYDAVNYVEMGRVLLRSWLTISSLADGGLMASTFRFNTVQWELFTPLVERMRPPARGLEPVDVASELHKFDYLELPNYKFMNYARSAIRPGQQVVTSVLQPEFRRQWLNLLGQSLFHVLSVAHLTILTDGELILVKDVGKGRLFSGPSRYGGAWLYVPLAKIIAASLEERENGSFALSIALPGGDAVQSLFEASKQAEVESLLRGLGGRVELPVIESEPLPAAL